MTIDPSPFEAAMPAAVRAELVRGYRGKGITVAWLNAAAGWQPASCLPLLHDPAISDELAGWLTGIAMFGDTRDTLAAQILERPTVIGSVIDAFVAGVAAHVPTTKGQWKAIDLLANQTVPDSLARVIAIGCASATATNRGAALRLARRIGAPARATIAEARAGAGKLAARRLDEALAALAPAPVASSADGELLERLLVAWRATRDPALEPAIARIGRELARGRGALSARSRSELEPRWLALAEARDPADVDRLIETPWPARWKAALVRVTALARFADDPRIAAGLLARASKYSSVSAQPLDEAIASVLVRMRTVSLAEPLAAVIRDCGPYYGAMYLAAQEAVEALEPAAAPPALLTEARSGERTDLAALWAAHVADPADLAQRAVLADALQIAGDPRGELISLQLADDAASRRRAAVLLAEHQDTWLGTLPDVDRGRRRFARGFVVALRCRASEEALLRTIADPTWVTVEDLALDEFSRELAPLIRRMPLLRRLAAPGLVLDSVACPTAEVIVQTNPGEPRPARERFPALKLAGGHWGMGPWDRARFRAAQAAAAAADVISVYLAVPPDDLAQVLAFRGAVPRETRVAISLDSEGLHALGWCVKLGRNGGPIALTWCGGPAHHRGEAEGLLDALVAAGAKTIAVHGPIHEANRRTLRRRGVEVTDGAAFDPLEP